MKKALRWFALALAAANLTLTLSSCVTLKNEPIDTLPNDAQVSDMSQESSQEADTEITAEAVTTEEETTEEIKPPVDKISITVNSVSLDKFVIVYDPDDIDSNTNSKQLRNTLSKRTGITLTTSPDTKAEDEYEIILGKTSRSFTTDFYNDGYTNANKFKIAISGKKIAILAINSIAQSEAINAVANHLDTLMSKGKGTLDLTDKDVLEGDIYSDKSVSINRRVKSTDIRLAGNNILFHQREPLAMYDFRKDTLLSTFVMFDADVLMLQECGYSKANSPSGTTWHDELYPILVKLGYTYAQCSLPANVSMNYTPIWYKADRVELVEAKYHLYDSVKYEPDQWLSESKSYTRAIFKDKTTGETFACISTHFTWAPDGFKPSPNELRLSDGKEVTAEVKALKQKYGKDFPIFLTGDLNSSTNDAACREIATEMKYVKPAVDIRNNVNYATTHALGQLPGEGGSIDHTYISGSGYNAVQYQHVVNKWTAYSTDHIPLLLDVDFTE